jgi:hypothetical protein
MFKVKFLIINCLDFASTYSTDVCKQHDGYWERVKSNRTTSINLTENVLQGKRKEEVLRNRRY